MQLGLQGSAGYRMVTEAQILHTFYFFLKLGFTWYKAEQPLKSMELQEKEEEKDESGKLFRKNSE